MSEAQTILKMIEEVSPEDTAKLDEIDARADAYVRNVPFHQMAPDYDFVLGGYWTDDPSGVAQHKRIHPVKYTRSRDSLKAIRPDGWVVKSGSYGRYNHCTLEDFETGKEFNHVNAPTEELAELHTIISAINWERTNGK